MTPLSGFQGTRKVGCTRETTAVTLVPGSCPQRLGGDQIIGGLKPQGPGAPEGLSPGSLPELGRAGHALFLNPEGVWRLSLGWSHCSVLRGLRAASARRPAALGDSIATAWESHKPRAGGEKAGGKRRGARSRERGLERLDGCRREEGEGGRGRRANKEG